LAPVLRISRQPHVVCMCLCSWYVQYRLNFGVGCYWTLRSGKHACPRRCDETPRSHAISRTAGRHATLNELKQEGHRAFRLSVVRPPTELILISAEKNKHTKTRIRSRSKHTQRVSYRPYANAAQAANIARSSRRPSVLVIM